MVVEDAKSRREKFVYTTAAAVTDDKWQMKLNLTHCKKEMGKK